MVKDPPAAVAEVAAGLLVAGVAPEPFKDPREHHRSRGLQAGGALGESGAVRDGKPRNLRAKAAKGITFTKEMNSQSRLIAPRKAIEKIDTLRDLFKGKTAD